MTLCPCPQQLLRFLDEDLEPDDQARILVHVEECEACQYRLEQLTRAQPPDAEGWTTDLVPEPSAPDPDPARHDRTR